MSKSKSDVQARVKAILDRCDGTPPDALLETLDHLEEQFANLRQREKAADDFEQLLAQGPREEDIHAFLAQHPYAFGHDERWLHSDRVMEGLLSKFPITPDRIPDLIFLSIAVRRTQHPNRIDVFELKRADVPLFASHNRLSKDLNDAWMEAVDTQRLIGLNYPDFIRRSIKEVAVQQKRAEGMRAAEHVPANDYSRPRCAVRILIGRRSSLSDEDMMRVRELGFSTNHSISVATYDSMLDDLRGRENGETSHWRW